MKLNKRLALGGATILAFAQTASAHTGDAPHNHPHASHNSISEYLMANPVVGTIGAVVLGAVLFIGLRRLIGRQQSR